MRLASTGQLLRRRQAALVIAGPPVAVFALVTLALVTQRGDARIPPDCVTFRFSPATFRAAEPNHWEPEAIGLEECGLIVGRTTREVRQLLGEPDPRTPGQSHDLWMYHDGYFQVRFNGERVLELYS